MKFAAKHLTEGEIRAYQDRDLFPAEMASAGLHLAGCQSCQSKASALAERSQRIQSRLAHLDSAAHAQPQTNLPKAYARLAERIELEKENRTMKPTVFARIPRIAWVVAILVVVLAVAFSFEPVRVLANNFLALFRVEQIRVVQFDSETISKQLENSSQLEYILSNQVNVEERGEPQKAASAEEAGALAGFEVGVPAAVEEKASYVVQPAADLSFTVDLELVRGVLKDLGREDIELSDDLDGAVVEVEIPSSVATTFGDCNPGYTENEMPKFDPDNPEQAIQRMEKCTTLFQAPSPQISAPPDLDINQVGEAYLQVLGMDAQEAASFASNVNWATTFVIPLPRNFADYEEVDLNGAKGTLIYEIGYGKHYLLMWIKDGMVFSLSGYGDKEDAVLIASSVQ
jgi:hypothetical protein